MITEVAFWLAVMKVVNAELSWISSAVILACFCRITLTPSDESHGDRLGTVFLM